MNQNSRKLVEVNPTNGVWCPTFTDPANRIINNKNLVGSDNEIFKSDSRSFENHNEKSISNNKIVVRRNTYDSLAPLYLKYYSMYGQIKLDFVNGN